MMKVGIQLYSVRNNMEKDPISTIQEVAKAGYRHLEVANYNADADPGIGFGITAKEVRALLDYLGTDIFSAHIFWNFTKKSALNI